MRRHRYVTRDVVAVVSFFASIAVIIVYAVSVLLR
jgi:hypothetical protein